MKLGNHYAILDLTLAFQVISEKFPLPGILLDVCLHLISI